MTKLQVEFKAYPDGRLMKVSAKGVVREGDYVEWKPGDWTTVDKGSPMIGQVPGTLNFLRIVPKAGK
jgi:hypothetical protein